jgi:hypothetical protein
VRRVVDGQATSPAGVDVRKGAVGKLRALLCTQPWHAGMFAALAPSTALSLRQAAVTSYDLALPGLRPGNSAATYGTASRCRCR